MLPLLLTYSIFTVSSSTYLGKVHVLIYSDEAEVKLEVGGLRLKLSPCPLPSLELFDTPETFP